MADADAGGPACSVGLRGQAVLNDPGSLAGMGWGPCLGTSLLQEPLEFGIHEGEASECGLVHGVDEVLVAVGQARLLIQELLVEVAVVSRGLLWAQGRGG